MLSLSCSRDGTPHSTTNVASSPVYFASISLYQIYNAIRSLKICCTVTPCPHAAPTLSGVCISPRHPRRADSRGSCIPSATHKLCVFMFSALRLDPEVTRRPASHGKAHAPTARRLSSLMRLSCEPCGVSHAIPPHIGSLYLTLFSEYGCCDTAAHCRACFGANELKLEQGVAAAPWRARSYRGHPPEGNRGACTRTS